MPAGMRPQVFGKREGQVEDHCGLFKNQGRTETNIWLLFLKFCLQTGIFIITRTLYEL